MPIPLSWNHRRTEHPSCSVQTCTRGIVPRGTNLTPLERRLEMAWVRDGSWASTGVRGLGIVTSALGGCISGYCCTIFRDEFVEAYRVKLDLRTSYYGVGEDVVD